MAAPGSARDSVARVTPVAQRRRGVALQDAILEAAYAELTAVGYATFSVEGVAARARTGKASIYRRWPTKQTLVLDALCAVLPTPTECGIDVDLNDENLTTAQALREIARVICRILNSAAGDAMRAVKCEAFTDPELARTVDERFQAPRREALLQILRRGVVRGEVRPSAVSDMIADVLPAVMAHRVILMREPVTETDITEIIDQVILPLVEVR
ncbi:MAG: TetR/AcrR family transcriptional regulator [Jatrophihabitantaceae bacterium]